ncbi:apolipoprotein N-acyltransferase [Buchananella felis]|uniref:apolipoprotein N-acyltransferase n=1 Tax=Buchananella felis TaxID=3231492 RepID=UPI0035279A8C
MEWANLGPKESDLSRRRRPLWQVHSISALLAGLVMAAAPPPFNLWWAAPLGLGLLGYLSLQTSAARATLYGFLAGLTYFLPTLYFIRFSLDATWVWVLLSAFEALFVAAATGITALAGNRLTGRGRRNHAAWSAARRAGALMRRPPTQQEAREEILAGRPPSPGVLHSALAERLTIAEVLTLSAFWALAFAGTDVLRSYYPWGGLAWANLSYTQVDGPLLAYVRLLSSAGLVAFLAFWGLALLLVLWSYGKNALILAGTALALSIAPAFVPGLRMAPLGVEGAGETVKVAAVQGNVDNPGMDAFLVAAEVTRNHAEETKKAAQVAASRGWKLDMVLWPENAADRDPRDHPEIHALVSDAQAAVAAPIAVGAVRYEQEGAAPTGRPGAHGGGVAAPNSRADAKNQAGGASSRLVRYNDIVLFDGAKYGAQYTKQVPVPFAEFLPMRSFVTRVSNLTDLLSIDMLPGAAPAILPVHAAQLGRTVNVGVGICFEVGVGSVMRQAARGEFLYIPTNNATFGYTAESEQQLTMTRLRAAEFNRPAVQISTVGVSGVVGPDGTLLDKRELFTARSLLFEFPVGEQPLTIAARIGGVVENALALGAALLAGCGLVVAARSRITLALSAKAQRRA